MFLADAVVSVVNESLGAIFNVHLLNLLSAPLSFLLVMASLGVYVLMGLTPTIPKRLFLPLTLFVPFGLLTAIPLMIYHFDSALWIACALSLLQLAVGLAVLTSLRGGFRIRWPLLTNGQLKSRRFSWGNLLGFLFINAFVLLPGTAVYLFVCASVAVDHFSEGFVALRSHGLTVQARKYVRDDGKSVQLFPMAHIADRNFYRTLADTFTSNSIALMEGVTDEQGLLTNHITYHRVAQTLGVAEQQTEFKPALGKHVAADVDISIFSTNTIGLLNLVMMVHAKGLRPEFVFQLLRFTPAPGFEKELFRDLLHKRNLHVVAELRTRLEESEQFIVPWGAAHMPGIAREIEKLGFRVDETRDYTVLRFRPTEGAGTPGPRRQRNAR